MLFQVVATEHILRLAKMVDEDSYGPPNEDGKCPQGEALFKYVKGGSVCAPRCLSDERCPPISHGAKGPAECLAEHCYLHCSQNDDCPQFAGKKSFCAEDASPFPICFFN
ncbi:hypothetical protein FOL47_008135 [Perkinsus chesapeaki]|uniref:Uncharacterized protein n=1 Tax=Perkinsus chesapeaki TaxID=330153 RepID=A0A7J6LFW6_PERCH|nr:hypothetical protein FOL47_008135 [Perkinsus chesapeaki]